MQAVQRYNAFVIRPFSYEVVQPCMLSYLTLGAIIFNLFPFGEMFSQTNESFSFSIQTSATFSSAETKIQKKFAHLAGLSGLIGVHMENFHLTTARSHQTRVGSVRTGVANFTYQTQHACFKESLNYGGIQEKWAIPVYQAYPFDTNRA